MKQFTRNNYQSKSIFTSFGGPAEAGSPQRDTRQGREQLKRGSFHNEEEVVHKRQPDSHGMGFSGQRQGYAMTPRARDSMGGERYTEKLLPNEIRVRADGHISGQIKQVMRTLSEGFEHCKVVGRGQAVDNVLQIL